MPSDLDAIKVYKENGILYGPAKAANAGGVAVSALEMSQNSLRLSWTREEVDGRLKDIMTNIFNTAKTTAETYGLGKDYLAGANIAAFENVANAMIAQGLVLFDSFATPLKPLVSEVFFLIKKEDWKNQIFFYFINHPRHL